MLVVYKYPLQLDRKSTIVLPAHAELLDVQIQRGKMVLWARVNTDNVQVCQVQLFIAMTGENLDILLEQCDCPHLRGRDLVYLSTIQDPEIDLVYHVFYTMSGPFVKHT